MKAKTAPASQPATAPPVLSHLDRVNQEMYKRNLELAEANKTLLMLRSIDEVVLSSVTDTQAVMSKVAAILAQESGFPFVVIYLRDRRQRQLKPQAAEIRIGEPGVQQRLQGYIMEQAISLRHPASPLSRSMAELLIVTTSNLFEVVQPHLPIDEAEDIQRRLSLRSFFICPLQSRGEEIGAMVLGSSQLPADLGFYQRSLLERLAVAVGIAIDNAVLYARTEEAASRLRTANRHLKELDKAKDEFISMASHQLRTPLSSTKDYLSILLEGDAGPINTTQRQFLGNAYGGSQRMLSIITDLLNVSRMSAGRFVIQKTPVDLAAMVAGEVKLLEQRAAAKKLSLRYLPPPTKLPVIELDADKTRQVIMNFIDNAIYYTKQGSVEVSLVAGEQCVELRVKDSGIGVPEAARKHLFTKFFRADNAQSVRPDGSGIGLFLAKRVVEDQGGSIIFESVEGQGSTFGFSVPLKPVTPAPAAPKPAA